LTELNALVERRDVEDETRRLGAWPRTIGEMFAVEQPLGQPGWLRVGAQPARVVDDPRESLQPSRAATFNGMKARGKSLVHNSPCKLLKNPDEPIDIRIKKLCLDFESESLCPLP
jgi:hypothetical protein